MKKWIKISLIVIGSVLLYLIVDVLFVFCFNRPIISFKGSNEYMYKGIFFNVYNCPEFSTPQIKTKTSKFGCSSSKVNLGKVKEIVDTSKEIKDFACAEALEEFYEDDKYTYYYSCIKSKYIIVKYENGFEESVSDALKYGSIKISDLDKYNIEYIKMNKYEYKVEVSEISNCNLKPNLYYEGADYKIYTFCLDSVKIINEEKTELKDYINVNNNVIDEVLTLMDRTGAVYDGGTALFSDTDGIEVTGSGLTIVKCNSWQENSYEKNTDVYIGNKSMKLKSNFCKDDNSTFVRTYMINDIEVLDNDIKVTLSDNSGKSETVLFSKYIYEEIEVDKTYEFEFMKNEKVEDSIKSIFENASIVEIRVTNKTNQINEEIN